MGDWIIGSEATSSMRKPFSSLNVFNSSSGVSTGAGGSLNFSVTSSGPALPLLRANAVWAANRQPAVRQKATGAFMGNGVY